MNRQGLLQTLQYLDPNGCWTDALARQEGLEPASLEDAIAAYEEMVAENN